MQPSVAGLFSKPALIFCCKKVEHSIDNAPRQARWNDPSAVDEEYHGEVTEWFKVHAWNACVREYREFESHLLRHYMAIKTGSCLIATTRFYFRIVSSIIPEHC